MRVLPLAILYKGSDDKLIEDAYAQSHIKHAYIRSKVCYALYCLWARSILNGSNIKAAWKEAVFKLCDYLKNKPNDLDELENHIKPDELETHTGRDYVVVK